jgi:hypothetical protein
MVLSRGCLSFAENQIYLPVHCSQFPADQIVLTLFAGFPDKEGQALAAK